MEARSHGASHVNCEKKLCPTAPTVMAMRSVHCLSARNSLFIPDNPLFVPV